MNKELGALKELRWDCSLSATFGIDYIKANNYCDIIEKGLERKEKFVEICKKHCVIEFSLVRLSKSYNDYVKNYKELFWNTANSYPDLLTEEEFNLLKEMLK